MLLFINDVYSMLYFAYFSALAPWFIISAANLYISLFILFASSFSIVIFGIIAFTSYVPTLDCSIFCLISTYSVSSFKNSFLNSISNFALSIFATSWLLLFSVFFPFRIMNIVATTAIITINVITMLIIITFFFFNMSSPKLLYH